jgi:hypothetical protein
MRQLFLIFPVRGDFGRCREKQEKDSERHRVASRRHRFSEIRRPSRPSGHRPAHSLLVPPVHDDSWEVGNGKKKTLEDNFQTPFSRKSTVLPAAPGIAPAIACSPGS